MKYFIISGSPIYGFRYVGPFDSHQLAEAYGRTFIVLHSNNVDWWVGELLTPEKEIPAK